MANNTKYEVRSSKNGTSVDIISTIHQIKEKLNIERAAGKTIGLVPTMGFLHHGHKSLIKKARDDNDVVVVSIFVNPTQFAEGEDLDNYPTDIETDSKISEKQGVDYIFNPKACALYPDGFQTYVNVQHLSDVLCGETRPSHFKGVATIVLKLFNIISPDRAYFGKKDYQQLLIIDKMVSDLNINVEIVPLPTVRDNDGLAASSRNSYLAYDEREEATILFQALTRAKELVESGTKKASDLVAAMRDMIDKRGLVEVEYIEIVDRYTLASLDEVVREKSLIAVAAKVGKARLIDNVEV